MIHITYADQHMIAPVESTKVNYVLFHKSGDYDLPAFFRKEGHTASMYALISDPQILELARCMLPSMPPRGRPLRLYPVYMLRGKVQGLSFARAVFGRIHNCG